MEVTITSLLAAPAENNRELFTMFDLSKFPTEKNNLYFNGLRRQESVVNKYHVVGSLINKLL